MKFPLYAPLSCSLATEKPSTRGGFLQLYQPTTEEAHHFKGFIPDYVPKYLLHKPPPFTPAMHHSLCFILFNIPTLLHSFNMVKALGDTFIDPFPSFTILFAPHNLLTHCFNVIYFHYTQQAP